MSDITRQMIDGVMPEGAIWTPEEDSDFDLFLEGMADDSEDVRLFLSGLALIRNPNLTPFLSDLEREFGIQPDELISDELRRMRLAAVAFTRGSAGTAAQLEAQLNAAGFDVQVHSNDPAVDPALFLDQSFQMVAGGGNAYAGRTDAFAGRIGGELLVNGDIFIQAPAYLASASRMYAGNSGAVAGYFEDYDQNPIIYTVPTDPDAWPFVFFVGGDATRDGSGALTEIQAGEVSSERQEDFKRTILKFKPLFTWAGLIIDYV
jgi:hypothetical protein